MSPVPGKKNPLSQWAAGCRGCPSGVQFYVDWSKRTHLFITPRTFVDENQEIATQDWAIVGSYSRSIGNSSNISYLSSPFALLSFSPAHNVPFSSKCSFLSMQCSEMCLSISSPRFTSRQSPCLLILLSNIEHAKVGKKCILESFRISRHFCNYARPNSAPISGSTTPYLQIGITLPFKDAFHHFQMTWLIFCAVKFQISSLMFHVFIRFPRAPESVAIGLWNECHSNMKSQS